MLEVVQVLRNWLKFRFFFSGKSIALSADVDRHSELGEGVTIGRDASVLQSNISDFCAIEASATLRWVKLAEHSKVYTNVSLCDVQMGRYSYISAESVLSNVSIGNFCSIGPQLMAGYGNHPSDWISTSPVFFSTMNQCGTTFTSHDRFAERHPICIGHDVWIGARVFIKDGVNIGDGAIVAAGAVVVSDVPPYAVVGGVPARVIRYRFTPEEITQLNTLRWWDWPEEKLKSMCDDFAQGDVSVLLQNAGGKASS